VRVVRSDRESIDESLDKIWLELAKRGLIIQAERGIDRPTFTAGYGITRLALHERRHGNASAQNSQEAGLRAQTPIT